VLIGSTKGSLTRLVDRAESEGSQMKPTTQLSSPKKHSTNTAYTRKRDTKCDVFQLCLSRGEAHDVGAPSSRLWSSQRAPLAAKIDTNSYYH
jgi:hypothetical protein